MNWLQHKPKEFKYRGKWIDNWFSNMVPSPITLSASGFTDVWPSVENYYQAMKTDHMPTQEAIRQATPSKSKQMGRRIHLRPGWEEIKGDVMHRALIAKFSADPWRNQLLATGDEPIIEWNNWGDRTWGVTEDGTGENRLGLLLMSIRTQLRTATK